MRILETCCVACMVVLLGACSSDQPPENVFKAQTDALGKAEAANQLLEDAAAAQRKAIDEQGR